MRPGNVTKYAHKHNQLNQVSEKQFTHKHKSNQKNGNKSNHVDAMI